MHLVDSNHKPQPEEGSISSSSPLPEQSLYSGEKLVERLRRDGDGVIEVVNLNGTEIHVRKFLVGGGQGPVALYLHGIEGHSMWFGNTASILNAGGISVYAPDRRGAGLNLHDRGHAQDDRAIISDVENILRLMEERHPQSQLFLIGNCWGAKAAAIIAAKTHKWSTAGAEPKLNGLVLICPAIKTKVDLTFKEKLSIAIELLSGSRSLQGQLPIPLACSMFTDNPVFLSYIEKDPLRLTAASKAFFFASWILSWRSVKAAGSIDLPTLILQSDHDAIVDVAGIKSWFAAIPHPDKLMKVYAGAAHSMDFDARKFMEYAGDLRDWILARCDRRGPSL